MNGSDGANKKAMNEVKSGKLNPIALFSSFKIHKRTF